jgi:Mce-associated membrane protein
VSEDKTGENLEDDTAVSSTETEVEETVETDKAEDTKKAEDAEVVDKADVVDEAETDSDETDSDETDKPEVAADAPKKRTQWSRIVAFALLPALALVLALGAGYLKWHDNSVRDSKIAADTSVQAARDITIALLSYTPDTVEQQLGAARDLLTGEFRDSYTSLTNDVVIPGAKEKQITAVASVPAAASVSATQSEAVVLVFVNQTVNVGQDPPTDTASSVRVTLDKVGDRWLISKFDPV